MKNPLCSSLLLALFVSSLSEGAVIDAFSGISQIAATGDPLVSPTSSISNNPGGFEDRQFTIEFGGGRMETTLGASGLNYSFVTEMAPSGNRLGYMTYDASSEDPINLMGNGESILRLEFSDLVIPREITLQINMWSGNGNYAQVRLPEGERAEAHIDIPFSQFAGVDFSEIDQIRISGSRFSSGTSFVLKSITTVPEPMTLGLAGLGGLGFLRRRR